MIIRYYSVQSCLEKTVRVLLLVLLMFELSYRESQEMLKPR